MLAHGFGRAPRSSIAAMTPPFITRSRVGRTGASLSTPSSLDMGLSVSYPERLMSEAPSASRTALVSIELRCARLGWKPTFSAARPTVGAFRRGLDEAPQALPRLARAPGDGVERGARGGTLRCQ